MKYTIIACLLLLASCSDERALATMKKESGIHEEMSIADDAQHGAFKPSVQESLESNAPSQTTRLNSPTSNLMLIKTGSMSITVADLQSSKAHLDSLVNRYKGYYQSDVLYQGVDHSSYELMIRLPVHQYDALPKALGHIGEVTHKSIQVQDVTKDYLDLELRLGHHEAYLHRYIKILERADSIKDVLTIQERIRVLEEEVESKKGHMRHIKDQASYSTLHLTLDHYHPQVAHADSDHFGNQVSSAFVGGFNGLLL